MVNSKLRYLGLIIRGLKIIKEVNDNNGDVVHSLSEG